LWRRGGPQIALKKSVQPTQRFTKAKKKKAAPHSLPWITNYHLDGMIAMQHLGEAMFVSFRGE
jgi:hypothetical protein